MTKRGRDRRVQERLKQTACPVCYQPLGNGEKLYPQVWVSREEPWREWLVHEHCIGKGAPEADEFDSSTI
jgi:hypothetical protein